MRLTETSILLTYPLHSYDTLHRRFICINVIHLVVNHFQPCFHPVRGNCFFRWNGNLGSKKTCVQFLTKKIIWKSVNFTNITLIYKTNKSLTKDFQTKKALAKTKTNKPKNQKTSLTESFFCNCFFPFLVNCF